MQPLPPSHALPYASTVETFERTPSEVIRPDTFESSKSEAATRTSSRRTWYYGKWTRSVRSIRSKVNTDLIGTHHVLIEDLTGNFVNQRVGDPSAIMTVGDFSKLVCADLIHRNLVCFFITLDRNLGGHPTNGGNLASKTR